jgi:hypothetical protein
MIERRLAALGVLIIAVVGIGGYVVFFGSAPISEVPPPDTPPLEGTRIIVSAGEVVLWADAEYCQDFMPMVPDTGPPFTAVIRVNITNGGITVLDNVNAPIVTLYYNGTKDALVTLSLVQMTDSPAPIVINPGETRVVTFANNRTEAFSPSIAEGTSLYSRVLLRWGIGQEVILTTCPSRLFFTF